MLSHCRRPPRDFTLRDQSQFPGSNRKLHSLRRRHLLEDNAVRCVSILLLAVQAAIAQSGTASIQGTVLDAKTQKPVPAAWVVAIRAGTPPFTGNTKSGGDGAFLIQGLTAGSYSLCVQVEGDQYLAL